MPRRRTRGKRRNDGSLLLKTFLRIERRIRDGFHTVHEKLDLLLDHAGTDPGDVEKIREINAIVTAQRQRTRAALARDTPPEPPAK